MQSVIHPLLALALVAPSAPVAARSPIEEPMTLVVRPGPDVGNADEGPRSFEVVPGRHVTVRDPEWSGSVEGALVEVLGGSSETPDRIQVQYETSVSIVNARSRLDLRDWNHVTAPWLGPKEPRLVLREWKHFTSPWQDLERDAKGRFRVVTLREEERRQFPRIDPATLVEAVRSAGGVAWADMVEDVSGPLEYPASVGVSAIRLRLVHGDSEAAFVVEFPMPPGC